MKTPAVTRPLAEDLVIVVWTLRTMARDGLDLRLTYSDVDGMPAFVLDLEPECLRNER